MGVSEFKAKALEVISSVDSEGEQYLLTKRGEPVARLVPFKPKQRKTRGSYEQFVQISDDIVEFSTEDLWESLNEDPA